MITKELKMQALAIAAQTDRSDQWDKLRRAYLKKHPSCAVCGTKKGTLAVHHKKPVKKYPELELLESNLITLCESETNCHLMFGHLKNWKKFNRDIETDAILWNAKIRTKPK